VRIKDAQDAESWNAFLQTYGPVVYRYARRMGLQEADAADVTQETMTAVARSIRAFQYQPERGRFRDWLGTVTRRQVGRFRQTQQGEEPGPDVQHLLEHSVTPHPDAEWTDEFNAQVLRIALERARPHFQPATWRAFECLWLENRSAAETADELGVPIETV